MRQNRQKNAQTGFTLLELVVVMLVIGLLLASVLKGAGMIHEAKLRKTAQMVEDIRTASNLFYREQGRLPGDGFLATNTTGVLDGWIRSNQGTEPAQFRRELIVNRYLTGKYTSDSAETWQNPLGGEVWVEYGEPDFGKLNYIIITGISADDLDDQKFLDVQFDDGNPATGNVRYSGSKLWIPL
jgi:prepilin-type N-terminal cleavage/methylation domain-containing protein